MKRILHLTLKKKWFDLIANDEKHFEYREIKEYWTKRLLVRNLTNYTKVWRTRFREFDEIYFRNGYKKDSPFMRVEWIATRKMEYSKKLHYAIELGKILEIRNYKKV